MKAEIENRGIPFFQLSSNQDLILFLISKELQGTKFTCELDKIGFDSSIFDIDLGVVILTLSGFKKRTDELWSWYYETLDQFVGKVNLGDSSNTDELAFDFYSDLRNKLKIELRNAP